MSPIDQPASTIIQGNFSKPKVQAHIQNHTTQAIIASLEKRRMPIDARKLRDARPEIVQFFKALSQSDFVEIHFPELTFSKDTFLLCCPDNTSPLVGIYLDDLLSVLRDEKKLRKISDDALEEKLTEIFEAGNIPLNFRYLSPREFELSKGESEPIILMESYRNPIYIPGEHFYSIRTDYDHPEAPHVSPQDFDLDQIESLDLSHLLALYIQRLFSSFTGEFDDTIKVELIRYDYRTKTTQIFPLSMNGAIDQTITEIKDRIPLLAQISDSEKIVQSYLDRIGTETSENMIYTFPGK